MGNSGEVVRKRVQREHEVKVRKRGERVKESSVMGEELIFFFFQAEDGIRDKGM